MDPTQGVGISQAVPTNPWLVSSNLTAPSEPKGSVGFAIAHRSGRNIPLPPDSTEPLCAALGLLRDGDSFVRFRPLRRRFRCRCREP